MIILDFDGTLVDVWERYYRIFIEGLKFPLVSEFSISEYKKLKRDLRKDSLIAEKIGNSLTDVYFADKRIKLESREYLKLDHLILNDESIRCLQSRDFMILSSRRSREELLWQLKWLKLPFDESHVVTVSPDEENPKQTYFATCYVAENGSTPAVSIGDSPEELAPFLPPGSLYYFVDTGLFSFSDVMKKNSLATFCDNVNSAIRILSPN